MKLLDVHPVRDQQISRIKAEVDSFVKKYGVVPKLAIILVGDDKASKSYIRTKEKLAGQVGISTQNFVLPANTSQQEIILLIQSLNRDKSIHGILLQLPLPQGLDTFKIIECISPVKDVDGLTSLNLGYLCKDRENVLACTPKGILKIFDYYDISLASKVVLIINRSDIVGKPLALALISKMRNATIIMANSKTRNIKEIAKNCDIIVTAVSCYGFIDRTWQLKSGVIVIDVSINRVPDSSADKGYIIAGDFLPEQFIEQKGLYTSVPGGVGLMTVCELLENTLELAKKQIKNN